MLEYILCFHHGYQTQQTHECCTTRWERWEVLFCQSIPLHLPNTMIQPIQISHISIQYQLSVFHLSTDSPIMINYQSIKHSQALKETWYQPLNLNYEVNRGNIVLQQRSYHLFQFGGTSFGRRVVPFVQECQGVSLCVLVPSRSVGRRPLNWRTHTHRWHKRLEGDSRGL